MISFTSDICSKHISYQLPVHKAANYSLPCCLTWVPIFCHSVCYSSQFYYPSTQAFIGKITKKMDVTFMIIKCQMHILLLFAAASCVKLFYIKSQSTSLTPIEQKSSCSIDSMRLRNANFCLRIYAIWCELVTEPGMRKKSAVTREGQKT